MDRDHCTLSSTSRPPHLSAGSTPATSPAPLSTKHNSPSHCCLPRDGITEGWDNSAPVPWKPASANETLLPPLCTPEAPARGNCEESNRDQDGGSAQRPSTKQPNNSADHSSPEQTPSSFPFQAWHQHLEALETSAPRRNSQRESSS